MFTRLPQHPWSGSPTPPPVTVETTPAGGSDAPPPELPKSQAEFFTRAAEKVRTKFPTGPGVYLFLDKQGRVTLPAVLTSKAGIARDVVVADRRPSP